MSEDDTPFDIQEWVIERDAVLLSMDEQRIREFFASDPSSVKMPEDMDLFWCIVHKAITAAKGLPTEFRQKSKDYLSQRGWGSLDNGELK